MLSDGTLWNHLVAGYHTCKGLRARAAALGHSLARANPLLQVRALQVRALPVAVPVAVAVEDLVVEGRVRHVLTLLSSRGVVGSRIGLTVLYSRGEVTQRRRHAASEASARVTVVL